MTTSIRDASPAAPALVQTCEPGGAVRRFAAAPRLWEPLVRFDSRERWYARVDRGLLARAGLARDAPEVWLLSWLPGQHTGIHDHGVSGGAFTVVSGTLTETVLSISDSGPVDTHTTTLRTGSRRVFDARHVHDVANRSPEPAVSIHAYAPELGSLRRYRLDAGVLSEIVHERAGTDW